MGGRPSPQLLVEWADRRGQFQDALRVLRATLPVLPPQAALAAFRADLLARTWPARALAASAALHVLFVFVPLPEFLTRAPAVPAGLRAVRIEHDLHWAGNARFLPPIAPKRLPKRSASPSGKKEQPLPRRGADVRRAQTIVSNPPEPNHPRQTLLTQLGLEKVRVPVRDLQLPNMVIPPSPAAAPVSELDLRRLRAPAALNIPGAAAAPQPPRPKLRSQLALAETRIENLFPRLAVDSGGAAAAAPPPDVGATASLASAGDLTAPGIIALSANPSAPRPVLELPEANLRARFTTGPFEGSGSPRGVPGGAPEIGGGPESRSFGTGAGGLNGEGGANGLSVPGVFVSNAGPAPPGPVIVGPARENSAVNSAAAALATKPDLRALVPPVAGLARQQPSPGDKAVEQRAEEMIEGPGRGARPSGGQRVYSVLINMPNLTSQTGSWVLRFAELGERATSAGGAAESFALEAPVAVKKVDPRYPGEARRDHLEGVVYLYGVIREDGTVESVRVVRSVHQLLDENAVAAFQRWQFEPGRKNGAPVALEVVVEIPFRLSRLF